MISSRQLSLTVGLIAGAVMLAEPVQAMPVLSFNFDITGVDFVPGGGIDFSADLLSITDQIGGTGALVGLDGDIGGAFMFNTAGEVTSSGGALNLTDGGDMADAVLDLTTISLDNFGSVQFVSLHGSLLFTSASGANADLHELVSIGAPYEISMGFAYNGPTTLAGLFAAGDGVLALVPATGTVELPEPHALALLGLGFLATGLYSRRRRLDRSPSRRAACRQSADAVDGAEPAH